MRLALINREQIQKLGSFLVDELDSLVSRIRAGWRVEHTDDGRHGHVHAETIATGRVVFDNVIADTISQASVDNYDPGAQDAAIVRINSLLPTVTLTGLRVPQDAQGNVLDGRVLILENVSTSGTVIILTDDGQTSFQRNRFHVPGGPAPGGASATNRVYVYPSTLVPIVYNATRARWFVVSQSTEHTTGFVNISSNQNDLQVTGSYRTLRTWRVIADADDLTISGFLSTLVPATERKTVVNDGVYTVSILHANTGSAAANRVYCPGGVRYLLHPRESVEMQKLTDGGWRILLKADQWVDVAFDAANFTASGGGTWTLTSADQVTYAYQIDGNKMTVAFDFQTTSVVTGPSALLTFPIPDGRVSARTMQTALSGLSADAGTFFAGGTCRVLAGATLIECIKLGGAAWGNATNNTYVRGQITFMIRDDCASISEAHTDTAHGDTAHADSEHSDTAHVDTAHADTHSDTAHADSSHGDIDFQDDPHDDVAHEDVDHEDVAHEDDPHDDVAHVDVAFQDDAHADAEHEDSHGDSEHEDHTDGEFAEPHADVEHADDPHADEPHEDDPHGDVAHGDTAFQDDPHDDVAHEDVAHEDTAFQDDPHDDVTHLDGSHSDTAHADAHSDTPHADVTHIDTAHTDTAHADVEHEDVGLHCDTAHSDI